MAQISVYLPDDLMAWAERQVAEGRYDSVGAYIVDLIARDRDHAGTLAASNAAIEDAPSAESAGDSIAQGVARRDRDGGSDALDELCRAWAQGIDSGAAVEGNFNAADIARRGDQSRKAVRKHG